jgi:hypothetical protein
MRKYVGTILAHAGLQKVDVCRWDDREPTDLKHFGNLRNARKVCNEECKKSAFVRRQSSEVPVRISNIAYGTIG